MRAPFKIVCEVIKYNELVDKDNTGEKYDEENPKTLENAQEDIVIEEEKGENDTK